MTTFTPAAATLAALFLPLLFPPAAGAASCREELDRFERELNESSLAAADPDRYAELARSAEEASELRDDELCMQRVAELRSALEAAVAPPATTTADAPAAPKAAAPPAPPLLLEAAPVHYGGDAAAKGSEPERENLRD